MLSDDMKQVLEKDIASYLLSKLPSFSLTEHRDTSFSRLGLDSLGHVELSKVIEQSLRMEVAPELAFNYPTVSSIIEHLEHNFEETDSEAL